MRQITGGDALFLYADKQSRHQHLSVLYCYDQSEMKGGPLCFKSLLEHVEKCLGGAPFFRQGLVEVREEMQHVKELNALGARLALFTGMAIILDNLAISQAVTSYAGKMVIAPVADRAIIPDPAFYADCLWASFDELKNAVAKPQKKARRKKTS